MISASILKGMSPDEAAALWLANGGPRAIAEAGLFDRWLVADEAHWQAWDQALAIWDSFDLAELGELDEVREEAVAARPEPGNDYRRWAIAASAAVVAITAGVVGYPYLSGPGSTGVPTEMARLGTPDIVTGPGESREVTLPDGSRLMVAGDTSLDIAFAKGRRDILMIKGRVSFGVAHDAAHPFAVRAGDQVVTARGTHFEIDLAPASVRVHLSEGSISVVPSDPAKGPGVILKPGQSFEATAPGSPPATSASGGTKTSIGTKTVVFRNQPLSEVVAIIGGPDKRLIVRNPKVARLRVSGSFQIGDVDNFVRAIEALHPVRVVPIGDRRLEIVPAR